jgi:hypothetical protein
VADDVDRWRQLVGAPRRGPFDFNRVPTAEGGLFIGDYQGWRAPTAHSSFADGTDDADPTDIYALSFTRARHRRATRRKRLTGRSHGSTADAGLQQQLDRIAQKTPSQRRIGPLPTARRERRRCREALEQTPVHERLARNANGYSRFRRVRRPIPRIYRHTWPMIRAVCAT